MTTSNVAVKKLNHSYESEPSSGIGSSLSEHHDSALFDEENVNFPYMLKTIAHDGQTVNDGTEVKMNNERDELQSNKATEDLDFYGRLSVASSEGSIFEGFSDDSGDERIEEIRDKENYIDEIASQQFVAPIAVSESIPATPPTHISPGKLRFPQFYDAITEENSCNAVDVLLSSEKVQGQLACITSVHSSDTSSELSFNGRIIRLTSESPSTTSQHAPLTIAAQRLPTLLEKSMNDTDLIESSFILKKYTNEKSPDLFGNDDDEEEGDEMNEKEDIDINKNPDKIQMFTYDEDEVENEVVEVVNEKHESPLADYNIEQPIITEANSVTEKLIEASNEQSEISNNQNLFRANCKRERELLRRTRICLSGIPPPPAMTVPQMDVMAAVLSYKHEILNFHKTEALLPMKMTESLLKPTHSLEETQSMAWKKILGVRQHGLSFNISKASEKYEYLGLSVIDRFVGAQTASSYQNFISSEKKRTQRLKMLTASPGSRLSHLAKRRSIFSSANLADNLQKSTSSLGTQILLDKRKTRNRRKATPKRKTPSSRKKIVRKTPTSSARKRVYHSNISKVGPSRESSKRALFQSPPKRSQPAGFLPKLAVNLQMATRIEKSKRALFSDSPSSFDTEASQSSIITSTAPNCSTSAPSQHLETYLHKRRRSVTDDDIAELEAARSNKMFRGNDMGPNLTPRALKIKSQSFCVGAGSYSTSESSYRESSRNETSTLVQSQQNRLNCSQMSLQNRTNSNSSIMSIATGKLFRTQSENTTQAVSNSLTENQRKKLLWAVSEALKDKKISSKHESFKEYASVLARVVRRIFQEYYQKGNTSNSETMLRLSKKYAYNVINGRNVDDIYFYAKAQIDDEQRRLSNRVSGYITPADYENLKQSQQRQTHLSQTLLSSQRSFLGGGSSLQNLFGMENSMDSSFSMNLSQMSSVAPAASATFSGLIAASQTSFQDVHPRTEVEQTCDALSLQSEELYHAQQHQPIQPNPTLQNSSSKNNLGGLALRENVDCEQRRSAQKNFTGKDQRNVSPYAAMTSNNRSAFKTHSTVKHELPIGLNAAASKAKRQISFDN